MDVNQPLSLLAGLTPAQFMRRHWQKKPLLVRQALPGLTPVLSRRALFALAARPDVEARLLTHNDKGWRMQQGPFGPRSFPALNKPDWTLLVQGVDLHDQKAHELLQRFRFVPDARLDDLMVSFATAGGGVGPHFDSYDVFLLQASGQRRWKISRQQDLTLQPGVPLKILQNFQSEEEFVLDAGDMLYLPPRYAHEGIAVPSGGPDGHAADCMTYSIGFRAPEKRELAAELLRRLADFSEDSEAQPSPRYQDRTQTATTEPAAVPPALLAFASEAVVAALRDRLAVPCALGEHLTELKPSVWFDGASTVGNPFDEAAPPVGILLDPKTRMMYDPQHVFINGESYRAAGADARLMQRLANQRHLSAKDIAKASPAAWELLADWHGSGWIHAVNPSADAHEGATRDEF